MIRTAQKAPKHLKRVDTIAPKTEVLLTPKEGVDLMLRERDKPCPRPANRRPDNLTVGECIDFVECGCGAKEKMTAIATAKKRGPKPSGNAKVLLTLRVDQDTIAKFKASGPGWMTRMVDALAAAALKLDAPAV